MREENDNEEMVAVMESVPEATACGHLDPMLRDWPVIASIAWEGFLASGRGHVLVRVEKSEVLFRYCAGVPCACHGEAVAEYDPEGEVVVAISVEDSVDVYRLASLPSPAAVWAVTSGSEYGATGH